MEWKGIGMCDLWWNGWKGRQVDGWMVLGVGLGIGLGWGC